MSSVDKRVAKMEFDNRRFEANVSTTLSTLERLKKALHFGDESDNLEKLQKASDSLNLSSMAKSLDNITSKFTLLGQVGFQAMEKIATAAVNAGERLVKSISVDQISAGMSKYEQETNSVQAIYAAVKRKGRSLDEVYASLDKLAEYSDETSYSYTQMVDGASKFIANGIDMDQAVMAMMGISNAAAQSGVSIQDASYAFRNFSDALSAGHFMIKDWQSIQNIHMDTEMFKNEVIASAKALGKLDAEGHVIDQATGKVKDEILTIENFRENLRYGFFDKDVMLDVLSRYADFDWDRVREGNFQTMADEAAAMAQQAKTFTDVIDSVKDAASTGWKESFRYIFGNLEEAIDFFTPMANNIISIVQEIGTARNELLSGWRDAGGRDSMIGALKTIWDTFTMIKDQVKIAGSFVWGANSPFGALVTGNVLADVTKGFQNATVAFKNWISGVDTSGGGSRLLKITNIFRGLGSAIDFVRQIFGGIGTFAKNIFGQLIPSFDAILSFFSSVGIRINRAVNAIRESGVITKVANRLADAFRPITSRLPELIKNAQQFVQNIITFAKTNPLVKKFTSTMKTMLSTIYQKLPDVVEGVIQFGKSTWEWIKATNIWKSISSAYNRYIKPIGKNLVNFGTLLAQGITDFFNVDTSGEEGFWNKLKKRFNVFSRLGAWLRVSWFKFKTKFPIVKNLTSWFSATFTKVSNWFKTSDLGQKLSGFWEQLKTAFSNFTQFDTSGISGTWNKIKARFEAAFTGLSDGFKSVWDSVKSTLEPIIDAVKDFFSKLFSGEEIAEATSSTDAEATIGKKRTVFDVLKDALSGLFEWVKGVGIGNLILWAYGILKVVKIIKSIKDTFSIGSKISGAFGSMTDMFDAITGKIKGEDKAKTSVSTTAKNILAIGAGVWVIVDAISKLGNMPWDQFLVGVLRTGIILGAVGAFIGIVNKYGNSESGGKVAVNFGSLMGTVAAIWLLAQTFKPIAEMPKDIFTAGIGRTALLLTELGAFIAIVNRVGAIKSDQSSPLTITKLIGTVAAVWLFGKAIKSLGNPNDQDAIGKGLAWALGILSELGLFIALTNRLGATKSDQKAGLSITKLIGTVAAVWLFGKVVKELGNAADQEAISAGMGWAVGILAMLGLFILAVNKLGSLKAGEKGGLSILSLVGVVAAIWILGEEMKALGNLDPDVLKRVLIAIGVLTLCIGALAGLAKMLSKLSGMEELKGIGGVIIIMGSLGAMMYVLSRIINSMSNISAGQMWGFAGIMLALSVAMLPLSNVVSTLGALPVAIALKGAFALVLIMGALGAGLAIVGTAISSQVSGFGSAMAELGSAMASFSEMTSALDGGVNDKLAIAKDMAVTAAEIAGKSYGGLDTFSTAIAKLGAGLRLFGTMTSGLETAGTSQLITDVVKMAGDLAGMSAVEDVSTTIANIGAAIKLYGENVNGVVLDNVPDSAKIAEIFSSIQEAATTSLSGDMLTEIGSYAGEGSTNNLTNFALGLTNIATAFNSFATDTKDINLENIEAAVGKLESLAGLTTKLSGSEKTITNFGLFSQTVIKESGNLTGFAEDIVLLGGALNDFATNIGSVNMMKMWMATAVLDSIAGLNEHMPKEGGLVQLVTGTASLSKFALQIRVLGVNLKSFNDSITGEGFDITKVKEGVKVIGELVEANQKLPKMGGLKSWFEGDESLSAFGSGLGALGSGMKKFATEFGDTEIGQNLLDAMDPLEQLIDMHGKLNKMEGLGDTLVGFSSSLEGVATHFKTMNATMKGITDFADFSPLEGILNFAADIDSKLSPTRKTNQLEDFIKDYKKLIKELIDLGNSAEYNFKPTENGVAGTIERLQSIANLTGQALAPVGESLGTSLVTALASGITNQNGASESAAGVVANNAANRIRGYYGQFSAAGGYLASGLANGLRSGTSQVVGAINSMSDAMVSAFRNKLRINSPSKVFAALGESIPEGLGLGVRRESGNTAKLAERLGQGMIDAFKDKLGIHSPSTVMEDAGKDYVRGVDQGIKKQQKSFLGRIADMAKEAADTLASNIADSDYKLAKSTMMPTDGSMTEEEFRKYYDSLRNGGKSDTAGAKQPSSKNDGKSEDKKDDKNSGGGKGGSKSDASSEAASNVGAIDYSTDIAIIITTLMSITDQFATLLEDLGGYIQYNYNGGLTSLGYTLASILENGDLSTFGSTGSTSNLTPVMDDLSQAAAQTYEAMSMSTPAMADQAHALAESMAYTESLNTIIAELQAMNERIEDMFDIVGNLQIVLDTGELVGGTVSGYDSEIGRRTSYADRGIAT